MSASDGDTLRGVLRAIKGAVVDGKDAMTAFEGLDIQGARRNPCFAAWFDNELPQDVQARLQLAASPPDTPQSPGAAAEALHLSSLLDAVAKLRAPPFQLPSTMAEDVALELLGSFGIVMGSDVHAGFSKVMLD
jgi:hypothetical protein